MRQDTSQVRYLMLSDSLTFSGLCEGPITVHRGDELHLTGLCSGKLVVEAGSAAYIRGMSVGGVVNEGGHVEVWGVVRGGLSRLGRTTTIHPNAQV